MDTNVMMVCECDTGWNVEEDGYKCYDDYQFNIGWVWFISSGY